MTLSAIRTTTPGTTRTTTRTTTTSIGVLADLRLLFGPEIDDAEIQRALEVAIDDLQALDLREGLLDEASRLAQLRLDARARGAVGIR